MTSSRPGAAAHRCPGQLTAGWRVVTGVTWGLVFVAFAGVWKVSRELGLSTWWLGPIGEPQPVFVLLLPFVAPVAMVVAALNDVRWLPVAGLVASAVTAVIGFGDSIGPAAGRRRAGDRRCRGGGLGRQLRRSVSSREHAS